MATSSAAVGSRLRVVQRSFLVRRGGIMGGRHRPLAATAVVDKSVQDLATHPRYIDAEDVHSNLSSTLGEQAFWGAKRSFYRKGTQYYPTWDRQAQTLILLCRQVPRVPQEAAFRLFAVFMKLLLLPQLMSVQGLALPLHVLTNVEGLIGGAQREQPKECASENSAKKDTSSVPVDSGSDAAEPAKKNE